MYPFLQEKMPRYQLNYLCCFDGIKYRPGIYEENELPLIIRQTPVLYELLESVTPPETITEKPLVKIGKKSNDTGTISGTD